MLLFKRSITNDILDNEDDDGIFSKNHNEIILYYLAYYSYINFSAYSQNIFSHISL